MVWSFPASVRYIDMYAEKAACSVGEGWVPVMHTNIKIHVRTSHPNAAIDLKLKRYFIDLL